jgi:hypothetical protein
MIALWPRITSRFGEIDSAHAMPHTGVDVALPIGSNVYAPESGIVSRIADYGDVSLGKAVFMKTGSGYQYIFGHLSQVKVRVGEKIHTGEVLGLSGNTGKSTGPHLHLAAVDSHGTFVDPGNLGILGKVVEKAIKNAHEQAKDKARDFIYDTAIGILEGLRDLIVDLSYSIALIGGGLAIILHIAGWEKGKNWAGILTVAYVLIKYLLG